MVRSATHAPRPVTATAAWVCLWVSTPTMMSVGMVPLMSPVLRSVGEPGDPAGGQDCDGMEGLSVHPGSCCFLAQPSQHEAHGGPAQECEGGAVQTLPILGQAATAVEPGDGPLDDPALRQHDELVAVGALDDLEVDPAADGAQPGLELRASVAAVGVEFQQERVQPEQRPHQQHAAVAVLDVGGVDDRLHQQALGVDQDVALLALDLLAGVVARRVDAAPPFSAPLTLWLSMIPVVGLAARPASSRHST